MTDKIKSAREAKEAFIARNNITGLTPMDKQKAIYERYSRAIPTILKALSAYERLQGAGIGYLDNAIGDLERNVVGCGAISDFSEESLGIVLNAAKLVADIGKETKNDE